MDNIKMSQYSKMHILFIVNAKLLTQKVLIYHARNSFMFGFLLYHSEYLAPSHCFKL